MNIRKLLMPALAAGLVFAGATASDAAVVHKRVVHRTWVTHNNGQRVVHRTTVTTTRVVRRPFRPFITRERAFVFFRARPGIRYVGTPYIYGNYYVQRCYDPVTGRLAFCEIDPYTGAWLGIRFTL